MAGYLISLKKPEIRKTLYDFSFSKLFLFLFLIDVIKDPGLEKNI